MRCQDEKKRQKKEKCFITDFENHVTAIRLYQLASPESRQTGRPAVLNVHPAPLATVVPLSTHMHARVYNADNRRGVAAVADAGL